MPLVLADYECYVDDDDWQRLYRHPSGIVVVCIGDRHPSLLANNTIVKVDFDFVDRKRRHQNEGMLGDEADVPVKKRPKRLEPNTKLCTIACADGTEYTIRAKCAGELLEVNKRLSDNCQLLSKSRYWRGYISVISTRGADLTKYGLRKWQSHSLPLSTNCDNLDASIGDADSC